MFILNQFIIVTHCSQCHFRKTLISYEPINKAPSGGLLITDPKHLPAIVLRAKKAQKYWVETGTNEELCADKGIRHNVSNTIIVDDWDNVEKYVYDARTATPEQTMAEVERFYPERKRSKQTCSVRTL